jgi:hypothetical protein
VAYGWQLTATGTGLAGAGVSRASLPTFSGPVTAGMTISMKKITGTLDLSSTPNVTLDRVWLQPQGGVKAVVLGAGTVIKDSDIDGSVMGSGERMGMYTATSGSYTVARVHITGMSIGAWLDGDGTGTVTDTYVHNMLSVNGAHVDGFTRRAGVGSLLISRSRFDTSGQPNVTGAFFLQTTWGDRIAGVTVKDTYLEGEGYVIVLGNSGGGMSTGLDNVRIRSIGWGPFSASGPVTYTAWNNVRIYDGNRLPNADGAAVNR